MKYFFLCVVLVACTHHREPRLQAQSEKSVFVCHSSDPVKHGKLCEEGCLQDMYTDAYCWELKKEDCEKELNYEWQIKNCHFFE
jgi:hypothetical protein|tara:strand:- start:619 stop:870 length:252 start_codon:yes stop_codon:yes gene_type:complete